MLQVETQIRPALLARPSAAIALRRLRELETSWPAFWPLVVACSLGLIVAACSNPAPPPPQFSSTDLTCVDDSQACISARKRGLNALMSDPGRRWSGTPPTSEQYAAGVRLFAYRKQRASLSCDELVRAETEAKGATVSLRGPGGQDLTPAQISRGILFGDEVARDMRRERQKRCRS